MSPRTRKSLSRAVAITTLVAFGGCASSTTIQSQPTGASVLVDGARVGQTPYTMTDTKIVGSTTKIRLEHPGYEPLDATISRNEEVHAGALIGGLLVLVPFLWIMKYKAERLYQLNPAKEGAPPAVTSGTAGYPSLPAGYPAQ